MERHPFVLGFILRKFPDFNFTMDGFDGRLRLQKFIYLLQAHDVYLGYDYSWYLRGPYCTTLATAGFILDDMYDRIPSSKSTRFVSGTVQKRFEKFAKFIRSRENDAKFLEATASLHFLLKTGSSWDDAARKIIEKMPDVDERYLKDVLAKLRSAELT